MKTQTDELYEQMRILSDGKLACACGNSDWKQFLYVQAGNMATGGCKRCGRVYQHDGTAWSLLTTPPWIKP